MNNLSWLLYLSSVVPNVGAVLVFVTIGSAFGCAYLLINAWVLRDVYEDEDRPEHKTAVSQQRIALRRLLPVAVISCLVAVLIPSKQVILMIAAAEMGEAVIKTPEAQELFLDLKAALKKQLEELK